MKRKKILSLFLCVSLLLGSTGAVLALNTGAGPASPSPASAGTSAVPLRSPVKGGTVKDESVYVFAGADGATQKVLVSSWFQNPASGTLADPAELENVTNLKGEETYTTGSDGSRVWNVSDQDLYYQGESKKPLPVALSITYQLDGKQVSPEELAGKSGQVTIRFDYENRLHRQVSLDGKQETMTVPFAVLTGLVLENDSFRNVSVSNGKLINDGERTLIAGLAFPGLQQNLGLDPETLELPDYVEITAEVKNFSLDSTVTLITNEPFQELDPDALSSGDLTGSLGQLTTAMAQLLDGSSQLYDGLCTLLDRSGTLSAGVDQLSAGAGSLKSGASTLSGGISELATGAGSLSDGLAALNAQSDALNAGAQQVFTSLLQSAQSQLNAAGVPAPTLTTENYGQVLDGLIAAAPEASVRLSALKQQLDSYRAFCQGLQQYTAGVSSAAQGASALSAGAQQLQTGSASLSAGIGKVSDGILSLKNNTPALTQGITALRDGALQLKQGLQQLDQQGIQKLVDAVDGDLGGLSQRLQAISDLAQEYQSFSGISTEMEGQVKFIYRTDSISAD